MKFKQIFGECAERARFKKPKEIALDLCEEAGEVAKAVNKANKEEIKSEIGDLILEAIGLYSLVEPDIETLKPLITRKINGL